jgi:hypothetical protein
MALRAAAAEPVLAYSTTYSCVVVAALVAAATREGAAPAVRGARTIAVPRVKADAAVSSGDVRMVPPGLCWANPES